MDFRQLESFLTIAKYNSFSKASRELFLTQPALSNQIQNLEKELQTPLFNRKGKTIELTPAGKMFREYAIELTKKKETAIFKINDLVGQFDGVIEIPSSTVPNETIVPQIISGFSKKYQGLKFHLFSMDSIDVIESITEKKYTIGFSGSKPNNDFEIIKVYSDDMVFIGPKSSPLDQGFASIADILNLPLILREEGSGSGGIISKALKKHNLSNDNLNIVAITDSVHVIKALVASGAGFAFVPRSCMNHDTTTGLLVYELKDIESSRDFYFIRHKKALLTPLEESFCEFVSSYFSK